MTCGGMLPASDDYFFVMFEHDAFGSHCEGSGTMPQAILKEASRGV
jgi:hypothetical protein